MASMGRNRVGTVSEMELMSPDERARLVKAGQSYSLEDLNPDFRARVESTSQRIAQEHGLLDTEST